MTEIASLNQWLINFLEIKDFTKDWEKRHANTWRRTRCSTKIIWSTIATSMTTLSGWLKWVVPLDKLSWVFWLSCTNSMQLYTWSINQLWPKASGHGDKRMFKCSIWACTQTIAAITKVYAPQKTRWEEKLQRNIPHVRALNICLKIRRRQSLTTRKKITKRLLKIKSLKKLLKKNKKFNKIFCPIKKFLM